MLFKQLHIVLLNAPFSKLITPSLNYCIFTLLNIHVQCNSCIVLSTMLISIGKHYSPHEVEHLA